MTGQHLAEMLERTADSWRVGPAPIATMVADARRARRRRTVTLCLASAAAVVVTAGVVAVLATPDGGRGPKPPATAPSGIAPASGTRLVGLGHAAVAVPEGWATNATRCGVPQQDTVVIDQGVVEACSTARPPGVESVELTQGEPRFDFNADQTLSVDGVVAQRQRTSCEPASSAKRLGASGTEICNGTVYLPSLGVSFRAESSTGADRVDRILDQVRIVTDQVGVPGYETIALDHQEDSGAEYLDALRAAGLAGEIRTRKVPGVKAGYLLDVTPAPGTMLDPGSVVTATVVAEPEGPADAVRVEMTHAGPGFDDYVTVDDPQIRAGKRISLSVGDRIWAYATGPRSGTLAGDLDGGSLVVDDWKQGPNYPHSWIAVAPGRTSVRLTITADGKRVVLGVVEVVVR